MRKLLFIPLLFLSTFIFAQPQAAELPADLQAEEAIAESQAADIAAEEDLSTEATPKEFIKQNPSLEEFLESQKQLWIQENQEAEQEEPLPVQESAPVEETQPAAVINTKPEQAQPAAVAAPAAQSAVKVVKEPVKQVEQPKAAVQAQPKAQPAVKKAAAKPAVKTAAPAPKPQKTNLEVKAETPKIEAIEAQEEQPLEDQQEPHNWKRFWFGVLYMAVIAGVVAVMSKYQ